MTSDLWVICQCGMIRHGSNSELIQRLHKEKYPDHNPKVVLGSETSPFMPDNHMEKP